LAVDSRLEELSQKFEVFAVAEAAGSSPLYERLSNFVAHDGELLGLAAAAATGPETNLFFAAAQYLLLREPDAPLAVFYPSLGGTADPGAGVEKTFRDFCLDRREAMEGLLGTRRVQTNEVRRSASLLLALEQVARLEPWRPLALVEIGSSAGLNLLVDRYSYDFGESCVPAGRVAPVHLRVEDRG